MAQEEFEHLAPRPREMMFSVGGNFFGNDDDAEDIVQEGMVAMLRYLNHMTA